MFMEFTAMKKDGTLIQFSVNINTGRVGNVAYEYYPRQKYGIPVQFDRATLLNILQDDDWQLDFQRCSYLHVDRFIRKALLLLLRAPSLYRKAA